MASRSTYPVSRQPQQFGYGHPTAERQCNRFESVGLSAYDILPWNAYLWYINHAPKAAELEAGVDTILEMLRLAPAVQVVLLQGGDARRSWRRVLRRSPNLTKDREITVVPTYHPGLQALWHKNPAERIRRIKHQSDANQQLAAVLA